MAIIGISGKIKSGKDTIGSIIQYLTTQSKNDSGIFLHELQGFKNKELFGDYNSYLKKLYPDSYRSNWEVKKFAGKLKDIASLLTGIPRDEFEKQEVKDSLLGDEWSTKHLNWIWEEEVENYAKYANKTLEEYLNEGNFELIAQDNGRKCYRMKHLDQNRTVRWLLQTLGTEAMRNHVHENVWINALFADYNKICNQTKTTKCKELNGSTFCYNGQEENQCKHYPNWIITDLRFPNELKAVEDKGGITIRVSRGIMNPEDVKNQHPSETSLDEYKMKYFIKNDGTIEELIDKVKEILIKEEII